MSFQTESLFVYLSDQDEKSTLDKPMDMQRRHSLVPPQSSGGTPTISITSEDAHSPDRSRRPSTHSLGPFSVSGFTEYLSHHRGSGDRSRRPSTHSVGILPISMFGEGGERPRRPSTHSLGVFPISCFGEEREGGKGDRPRRLSTHSLGPLVVPVSFFVCVYGWVGVVDPRGSESIFFLYLFMHMFNVIFRFPLVLYSCRLAYFCVRYPCRRCLYTSSLPKVHLGPFFTELIITSVNL